MKVASGNVLWRQRKRNWCRTPFTFTVYTLTDRELSVKTGILNERFNLIKLFRIVDISVERTFLQRIFGMSTLVLREKSKYGWEFIFLGANMNAIEAAGHLGIHEDRAVQFLCDEEGIQKNFEAVDDFCDHFVESISVDWKKGIEEDFKRRGRK